MTVTISKVEIVIPDLDPVATLIDECEYPAEQGMGPSTAMIKAAQEHHERLLSLLIDANNELCKATRAMDNGSDDSRWAPGETAIDALTRERNAMRDRAEQAEAKLASIGELVALFGCSCCCDDCGQCLRCRVKGLVTL